MEKDCDLRVFRLSEFLRRTLKGELSDIGLEDPIRFFVELSNHGEGVIEISPHTHILRALTWKQETKFHRIRSREQ